MRSSPTLALHPLVAVLVPASTGWGRSIISGVAAYANRHGPWHLYVEPEGERQPLPHGWKGDGIIARISTPTVAKALLGVGCPLVNVSGITLEGLKAQPPRVSYDLRATGSERVALARVAKEAEAVGPLFEQVIDEPILARVVDGAVRVKRRIDDRVNSDEGHALQLGRSRGLEKKPILVYDPSPTRMRQKPAKIRHR